MRAFARVVVFLIVRQILCVFLSTGTVTPHVFFLFSKKTFSSENTMKPMVKPMVLHVSVRTQ